MVTGVCIWCAHAHTSVSFVVPCFWAIFLRGEQARQLLDEQGTQGPELLWWQGSRVLAVLFSLPGKCLSLGLKLSKY